MDSVNLKANTDSKRLQLTRKDFSAACSRGASKLGALEMADISLANLDIEE